MDINVYLFIVIALMLLIIMYLLFVLRRVRTQLVTIKGFVLSTTVDVELFK